MKTDQEFEASLQDFRKVVSDCKGLLNEIVARLQGNESSVSCSTHGYRYDMAFPAFGFSLNYHSRLNRLATSFSTSSSNLLFNQESDVAIKMTDGEIPVRVEKSGVGKEANIHIMPQIFQEELQVKDDEMIKDEDDLKMSIQEMDLQFNYENSQGNDHMWFAKPMDPNLELIFSFKESSFNTPHQSKGAAELMFDIYKVTTLFLTKNVKVYATDQDGLQQEIFVASNIISKIRDEVYQVLERILVVIWNWYYKDSWSCNHEWDLCLASIIILFTDNNIPNVMAELRFQNSLQKGMDILWANTDVLQSKNEMLKATNDVLQATAHGLSVQIETPNENAIFEEFNLSKLVTIIEFQEEEAALSFNQGNEIKLIEVNTLQDNAFHIPSTQERKQDKEESMQEISRSDVGFFQQLTKKGNLKHGLFDQPGWLLQDVEVLNGSLKPLGNSWGFPMCLVCPEGHVVAYAWKCQISGQSEAAEVDRTWLAHMRNCSFQGLSNILRRNSENVLVEDQEVSTITLTSIGHQATILIEFSVHYFAKKITFSIWNWFYKEFEKEREMEHPSQWNKEWKIAWKSEWERMATTFERLAALLPSLCQEVKVHCQYDTIFEDCILEDKDV